MSDWMNPDDSHTGYCKQCENLADELAAAKALNKRLYEALKLVYGFATDQGIGCHLADEAIAEYEKGRK